MISCAAVSVLLSRRPVRRDLMPGFFTTARKRAGGYHLIYLWVPFPEYSAARVARRVSQGGHSIPKEVIYRRYRAGLWNMRNLYLPLVEDATIYDNSDDGLKLVARRAAPKPLVVVDEAVWSKIEEMTKCEP